jgi:hypothetical protein
LIVAAGSAMVPALNVEPLTDPLVVPTMKQLLGVEDHG